MRSCGERLRIMQILVPISTERGHVTYFWNFGTPSISRELLEIETSNLAHRFITSGTKERNAKLGQRGSEGVTWDAFEILEPLHMSGMVGARNVKFGVQLHHESINEKNKIMLKGSRRGRVTYFWNFGTPPYLMNDYARAQPFMELSYQNLVLRETWTLLNECCYWTQHRGGF